MAHLLIFENILKNNYLINFNKKSEMPITVNPFESNDSSSGLLITIIFWIEAFKTRNGLTSLALVATFDISLATWI